MSQNGVSDTLAIRRFGFKFGIYDRDKIPVYILQAVQEIEHPKWKAFFTQQLIVKHNHLTVQRCIDAHRVPHAIPELLDMEDHVLPPNLPHQSKPSEFFDTITVPHEAEMNQRWSQMQARKDADSKRKAAAGANEASAQPKRSTRKIT